VTGGLGFIGSHLSKRLILQNYDVLMVDNESTGTRRNLANIDQGMYTLIASSIGQSLEDIENFKPEYIFHIATWPRIQPSFTSPTEHEVTWPLIGAPTNEQAPHPQPRVQGQGRHGGDQWPEDDPGDRR